MEKKRKLKYLYQRMPDEKVGFSSLNEELSKRTGFAVMNIEEVMNEFSELVQETIISKKSIFVPGVGTLFPTIKPGKNVVKMNKHNDNPAELMYMPDRWVCKFKVKPALAKRLLEIKPTKKEVDNIYRD